MLRSIVERFIADNEITCPEVCYQTDRVFVNAPEFIEKLCNLVGYCPSTYNNPTFVPAPTNETPQITPVLQRGLNQQIVEAMAEYCAKQGWISKAGFIDTIAPELRREIDDVLYAAAV